MAQILVVDDDPGTVETFGAILTNAGHQALLTHTVGQGLSAALSRSPDMILVDLRLSDRSGLEFLAEALARGIRVPIVIMTAFGTDPIRSASRQLGAADFIEKPIDEKHLLQLIHRYTDHAQSSRLSLAQRPGELNHAATRWTAIVTPIIQIHHDVPTIDVWAREVGHSQATLKRRCSNAGVKASDSLDFARALRIVAKYGGRCCPWFEALAIAETITLNKFLCRSGFQKDAPIQGVRRFLSQQRFITDTALLHATLQAMMAIS
jgi:DNA-binding response OmpR family regulator